MTSSENQNKICAVVPFYNEETHLKDLAEKVLNYVDLLILIDDGSTDNSVNTIPSSEKIILLKNKNNLGKGAALRLGFEESIRQGSDITISLDADNQHDPTYIPFFVEQLQNSDCVIGNRLIKNSSMPIHRQLSNFLTSKLLSIKTGLHILDSQSGYRAFRTSILPNILPDYSGFESESEMIVKMARNKINIGFLEISTIYGNDNSKMKALPTILGFLKVILKS